MRKLFFLPVLFCFSCQVSAQQHLTLGEMRMDWRLEADSIWIQLKAPTLGWVGIGFNDRDQIVGADLLLFAVTPTRLVVADQFVQAPGQHPDDTILGGQNQIRVISGSENTGHTLVRFKIPLHGDPDWDFQHAPARPFWLILAYSQEDDFNHHSRMRKHHAFSWKP